MAVRNGRKVVAGLVTTASLAVAGVTGVAAAGSDGSFSSDGRQRTTGAVRTGAVGWTDGSATAVGVSSTDGTDAAIVRFSSAGAVIGTGTVAGNVPLEDVRGVAASGGDTLVQFHTAAGPAITRIGPTGAVVGSFGGGDGWVHDTLGSCGSGDGQIGDLAVAPDGSIYTVAWNFLGNTPSGCDGTSVRRYDAAGNRVGWGATRFEDTFVDNRLESAAIAVDGAGNVYTAGVVFGASSDAERVGVLKVSPAGVVDQSFGSSGLAAIHPGTAPEWYGWLAGFSRTDSARTAADLVIDGQGRILLVGSGVRQAGGGTGVDTWVARLLADGTPDPSFGRNGVITIDLGGSADYGLLIELDASGRPVVAGATQPDGLDGTNDQRAEFTALLDDEGTVLATAITASGGPTWPVSLSRAGHRLFTAGHLPAGGDGYLHAHAFDGGGSTTTTTTTSTTTTQPTTTTTAYTTTTTTHPATTTTQPATTTTTQPGSGGGSAAPLFTGVTPWRALDTRTAAEPLLAGRPRSVLVTGRGGVPDDAIAVGVNITVIDPSLGGYLAAYPAAGSVPHASTVNFAPQQTIANAIVVGVGRGGSIDLDLGAGRAHVAVDVTGFFRADRGFEPSTPVRALDTRHSLALGPNETRSVTVAGLGGAPGAGAASAVALTVTAVDPTAGGHLRAWPGVGAAPHSSVVNFAAAQTVANAMILGVDANGQVSLANHSAGTVHLVIDVSGTFTTAAALQPITPVRALDSRADGRALGPGGRRVVRVTGIGEVPAAGVRGVVLNVTVTEPTAAGYFSAFPAGGPLPTASLLNFTPGTTVANAVVLGVSADGTIELANSVGSTHAVVDVLGWF